MRGLPERETINLIARKCNQSVKMNPGDTYDEDGLLVCGVCGKRKQSKLILRDGESMIVRAMCECEIKADEEAERRKRCECEIQKLRSVSLIHKKFRNASFDTYDENNYNAKNRRKCERYAKNFETMRKSNEGLLLWGDVGTGKSHTAACIANYLISQSIPAIMTSFVMLMAEFGFGAARESELMSAIASTDLVILDDLGAERDTEYAQEKVYSIIETRYRSQKPLILTTNLSLTEMMNEEDTRYKRVYDRVFEMCHPIQFTGPSRRKTDAAKRFDNIERFLNGE